MDSTARALEIFDELVDVEPSARTDRLDELCGGDGELREQVERLLAADAQTADASVRGIVRGVLDAGHSSPRMVGKKIGNYTIKSFIGSGGMAQVYLAVQEHPRRKVALKLMKSGISSRSALRRFEFESQLLGRLRHPNIAQIFEAGTHDEGEGGVPYFAMEYIPNAKTITEFAKLKDLSTKQRLALFAKVCDAVHHGHQKGIIHRDLKPGNILVDSSGEPKVIDFGVARSTDSDMAVTTLQTDVGQLIGTLQYMSPEQCAADPDDLDTRSDVYALGVVLYELLCEQLPYDLSKAAVYEAARIIREESPVRPSTINRTLRGDVETIALKALEKDRERRYRSAEALGDDIHKYLSNEPIEARPPSLRYQIKMLAKRNRVLVGGAAAVLVVSVVGAIVAATFAVGEAQQRELAEQREVEANNATSRAQQQTAIASAARDAERAAKEDTQVALTLAQKREQEAVTARAAETKRAEELELVAEYQASQLSDIDVELMGTRLREDLLAEARLDMERRGLSGEEITAAIGQLEESLGGTNLTNVALDVLERSILDRALEAVDEQFADQPLVRARLLHTLAVTLRKLGLLDRATAPLIEALEIRRRVLGDEHPDTLNSINSLAVLLQLQGKLTDAEPYYREALEVHRRVLGDEHPDTLNSIGNMGALLRSQSKLTEAEPFFIEALEGRRRVLGDDHPNTLTSINNMGSLLQSQGKLAEAEPYFREALEGRRRVLGDEHPNTLNSIINMGGLLRSQGKLTVAEPYYREALEVRRRVLGDEHPNTLKSIGNMGSLLQSQGKLTEAEPYYREALEGNRRVHGDDHPDTAKQLHHLADVLRELGTLDEAEEFARQSLDIYRADPRTYLQEHLHAINILFQILTDAGRTDDVETLLRENLDLQRQVRPASDSAISSALILLGINLVEQEKYAEGEPYFREALEVRRRVLGDEHPDTLWAINNMGFLLQSQGKLAEAEPYYREALEGNRRVLGDENLSTLISIHSLAGIARDQGELERALVMFTESVAGVRAVLPETHTFRLVTIGALGQVHGMMGRYEFGEALLLEAEAGLQATLGPSHKRTLGAITSLADLYTAWHESEPGKGYDAKAAQWQAKLPPDEPAEPEPDLDEGGG